MREQISPGNVQSMYHILDTDKLFDCHSMKISSVGFGNALRTVWGVKGGDARMPRTTADAKRRRAAGPQNGGEPSNAVDEEDSLTAKKKHPILRRPRKKPKRSCATQQFIYLKTHKTGSSTILSILHNYAYNYGLNSALPIDNMYVESFNIIPLACTPCL